MEKKIKHKLGVVVPYRDREEQLKSFVSHMSEYLSTIDHTIIVVEQSDDNDFNRGKLLNIGFNSAVKEGCDYVVFHDVDLLPIKADYSYTDRPTHLIGDIITPEGFDRTLFDEYFGGVTLFPASVFQCLNILRMALLRGYCCDAFYIALLCKKHHISENDGEHVF